MCHKETCANHTANCLIIRNEVLMYTKKEDNIPQFYVEKVDKNAEEAARKSDDRSRCFFLGKVKKVEKRRTTPCNFFIMSAKHGSSSFISGAAVLLKVSSTGYSFNHVVLKCCHNFRNVAGDGHGRNGCT